MIGSDFPLMSNMVVLIDEHSVLLKIQAQVKRDLPNFNAVFSQAEYLHIAPVEVCKASGLVEFAKLHDLSLDKFIAFGDGQNDISMLEEVGLGVAMANASEQVKKSAKQIAASNEELGVVKFIYESLEQGLF